MRNFLSIPLSFAYSVSWRYNVGYCFHAVAFIHCFVVRSWNFALDYYPQYGSAWWSEGAAWTAQRIPLRCERSEDHFRWSNSATLIATVDCSPAAMESGLFRFHSTALAKRQLQLQETCSCASRKDEYRMRAKAKGRPPEFRYDKLRFPGSSRLP